MNSSDPEPRQLTDGDVDELLSRCLPDEVPVPLRGRAPVPPPAPHRAAAGLSPRSGSRWGAAGAVVAGLCALGVTVAVFRSGPANAPSDSRVASAPAHPATTAPAEPLAGAAETGTADLRPVFSETLERTTVLTPDGPVEERLNLNFSNTTIQDPATGRPVETLVPELEIELFPLEAAPR